MAGRGKPGPRSSYTPQRAERMCELIAQGYTLRQVAEAEGVDKQTITNWLRRQPAFRQQYDQAFSLWCEIQAHEMVDIASDGSNDWMDRETASGRIERVVDYEHIHRSKLRIDTIKWLMARRNPKRWGDRVEYLVQHDEDPAPAAMSVEEQRERARKAIEEAFAEQPREDGPVVEQQLLPPPSDPASPDDETPSDAPRSIPRRFALAPEGTVDLHRYRPPRPVGTWSG